MGARHGQGQALPLLLVAMTPEEKALYHQIHPLKLAADIGAEAGSLYLFWERRPTAGLAVTFVPPVIASLLIMNLVDLEPYKRSACGRYVRTNMTTPVVMMRVLGTLVTRGGVVSKAGVDPSRVGDRRTGLDEWRLAPLRLWPGAVIAPGARARG